MSRELESDWGDKQHQLHNLSTTPHKTVEYFTMGTVEIHPLFTERNLIRIMLLIQIKFEIMNKICKVNKYSVNSFQLFVSQ